MSVVDDSSKQLQDYTFGTLANRTLDLVDSEKFLKIAAENAEAYQTANPFPHIVLDNLFPPDILETVLSFFPDKNYADWKENKFISLQPGKQGRLNVDKLPDLLRYILYQFNAKPVIEFLEKLTGIKPLLPDPTFLGGGLHQILPGGFLEVHSDFNKHPVIKLHRRINLLVYLNKDWQDDYNGQLELWQTDMSECVKKVAPLFNRCVVFNTTENSFHGHPVPLSCPEDRTRKSIALYYYTADVPETELAYFRPGNWQQRPDTVNYLGVELERHVAEANHWKEQTNLRDQQLGSLAQQIQAQNVELENVNKHREDLLTQVQELQTWAKSLESAVQQREGGLLGKVKKIIK